MCEPMVDQRDYLKSPLQTPSCLWAGAEHRFPLIKGQRKGNKGRVHSRVQVPPGVIPSPGSWSDPSSAQCSQRARTALAMEQNSWAFCTRVLGSQSFGWNNCRNDFSTNEGALAARLFLYPSCSRHSCDYCWHTYPRRNPLTLFWLRHLKYCTNRITPEKERQKQTESKAQRTREDNSHQQPWMSPVPVPQGHSSASAASWGHWGHQRGSLDGDPGSATPWCSSGAASKQEISEKLSKSSTSPKPREGILIQISAVEKSTWWRQNRVVTLWKKCSQIWCFLCSPLVLF